MKLDSHEQAGSFYESFSDLIFATMAIFVLLMLVFLIQVNQAGEAEAEAAAQSSLLQQQLEQTKTDLRDSQREADQLSSELSDARTEAAQAREELKSLAEAVQAQSIEIVIAVDATGSMGDGLTVLQETIATVAKLLPQVAPEVRIGIVSYRQRPNERRETNVFPSAVIQPWSGKTPSRSFIQVKQFVDSLAPENGRAPLATAVKEALNLFQSGSDAKGSQTLMLIGDVGPWESSLDSNDLRTISAQERAAARDIQRQVRDWVSERPRRTVVSIFQTDPNQEPSSTRNESVAFFRDVGAAGGDSGRFTVDHRQMLEFLLEATLAAE
ncbi:MAG: hypothetical protein Tsb0013_00060 [Phycisphaerales bacterium]